MTQLSQMHFLQTARPSALAISRSGLAVRPADLQTSAGITAPSVSGDLFVRFGLANGVTGVSGPNGDRRIPDPAYRFLVAMPKTELHVHQSGSSDIAFLKYALLRSILEHRFKTLELVNPKTGKLEVHRVKDLDQSRLQELLDLDNVRRLYRVAIQHERQKIFANDQVFSTQGRPLDAEAIERIRQQFKEEGLQSYRNTSRNINMLVKNMPAAYELAERFAWDVAQENVRYTEYRISPMGYMPPEKSKWARLKDSLLGRDTSAQERQQFSETVTTLVHWVNDGFKDAQTRMATTDSRKPLEYGLILLMERQGKNKVENAIKIAEEAIRLRKEGYPIAGVDLAGDELNNPVTDFADAFALIRNYNEDPSTPTDRRIGITVHAGETPTSGNLSGSQSVAEAIRLAWSPNTSIRIGHGLQVINSSSLLKQAFQAFKKNPTAWQQNPRFSKEQLLASSPLLKEIIDKGIVLEMCPKSNVQTLGVAYHTEHPAVFLSRLGVKVAISSDNRTISNTDTPNEYVKLFKYAHATYNDIKQMVLNGFEGAFIFDPVKKNALMQQVKASLAELEAGNTEGVRILNHPYRSA